MTENRNERKTSIVMLKFKLYNLLQYDLLLQLLPSLHGCVVTGKNMYTVLEF